jgi:hypothetical protein
MASIPYPELSIFHRGNLSTRKGLSVLAISAIPPVPARFASALVRERIICQSLFTNGASPFRRKDTYNSTLSKTSFTIRSSENSNSSGDDDKAPEAVKAEFGYSRKDVILIGVGVTLLGVGLKSGLEFYGVDPLQAGNVVQLVLVLGLTIGWISTYIFRVSNKEMTYAQQLRDYENKVMQKRLEGLSEAELEALLEQVEEEKTRLARGEKVN